MAYCSGSEHVGARPGRRGGAAAEGRPERLASRRPRRRGGATGDRRWPAPARRAARPGAAPPTSGRRRRRGRAPTAGWRWRTRGRGRRRRRPRAMSPAAKRTPAVVGLGCVQHRRRRVDAEHRPDAEPLGERRRQLAGPAAEVDGPADRPRLDQADEVPERLGPLGRELAVLRPGPSASVIRGSSDVTAFSGVAASVLGLGSTPESGAGQVAAATAGRGRRRRART